MSRFRKSDGVFHRRNRVDFIGEVLCQETFPGYGNPNANITDPVDSKLLRVCVVTNQVPNPDLFSSNGTNFCLLAEHIAKDGHQVEVLYVGDEISQRSLECRRAYFRGRGINLTVLGEASIPIQKGPSGMAMEKAYNVYEHLKTREADFDLVHAPDTEGLLFLCAQSKACNLFFKSVTLVVHAVAPTLWERITNSEPINDVGDLAKLNVERRAVESADFVVSPSQYMLRWMKDHGYKLPSDKTFVIPKLKAVSASTGTNYATTSRVVQSEIVYVGEISSAHGIHMTLDALLRIKAKISSGSLNSITVLGPSRIGHDLGAQFAKVEKEYGFKITVRPQVGSAEIVRYLLEDARRLAVMPAVANNSHDVLCACLRHAIPVLLTDIGVGSELRALSKTNCKFVRPLPSELAAALLEILEQGLRLPGNAVRFHNNMTPWSQFHIDRQPMTDNTDTGDSDQADLKLPLVSVCIAHHNRGELLENAIESLEQQTYNNIEIVVVDDGSEDPFALAVLDEIEVSQTSRFPIRVIRQQNRYLGAVRNTGIKAAHGKYILFMDDDNEAKPHEVETFVKVALFTGSDILTCLSDMFAGERPDSVNTSHTRIVFHGINLAMAMVRNPYGDSNCFVLRSYAEEIRGFSEHYKVGLDDMEFFTRAILSSAKLTLVPEALYWYRINEVRMRQGQYNLYAGRWRVSEVFTQGIHPDLANIVHYAMGMGYTHGPWSPPPSRQLSIGMLECGRRLVHRFPFLYPIARRVYRLLH